MDASILGRAIKRELVDIRVHNLRDFSLPPHNQVDDYVYGGGPGQVLKPEPLARALQSLSDERAAASDQPAKIDRPYVIALTPTGRRLDRDLAVELSERERLVLLCGRYEGFDQRVLDRYCDLELSIGDYVLTGGEFAALVVVDAVVRRIPGVVGNKAAVPNDSFERGLLEPPRYTRPASFDGMDVPPILLSGDHAKVDQWRLRQALKRTLERRPDLLESKDLPEQWRRILRGLAVPGESQ